jgi:hypothetical protein
MHVALTQARKLEASWPRRTSLNTPRIAPRSHRKVVVAWAGT